MGKGCVEWTVRSSHGTVVEGTLTPRAAVGCVGGAWGVCTWYVGHVGGTGVCGVCGRHVGCVCGCGVSGWHLGYMVGMRVVCWNVGYGRVVC